MNQAEIKNLNTKHGLLLVIAISLLTILIDPIAANLAFILSLHYAIETQGIVLLLLGSPLFTWGIFTLYVVLFWQYFGKTYGILALLSVSFTFLTNQIWIEVGYTWPVVGTMFGLTLLFNLISWSLLRVNWNLALRAGLIVLVAAGLCSVSSAAAQMQIQSNYLDSIEAAIYYPTGDQPFSYESFYYSRNDSPPYFVLNFEQYIKLSIYNNSHHFNPPQNCGNNPAHTQVHRPCTKLNQAAQGAAVWKYIEQPAPPVNSSSIGFQAVKYYTRWDNSIIEIRGPNSSITDTQAIQLLESLEPITPRELLVRDPNNAEQLQSKP